MQKRKKYPAEMKARVALEALRGEPQGFRFVTHLVSRRLMFEDRLEETEDRSGYPQLPHHRVVTIGVARLEPESGRFKIGTPSATASVS